jgi:hypothetical protein
MEVYGRVVAWTLYAAIVITSIGACSAYLVFWYLSSRPFSVILLPRTTRHA